MSLGGGLKAHLSKRLWGSRAYIPIRALYQVVFNRSAAESRKTRREFYRQFVTPGSLVFDVGANVGEYTLTFLQLGARVVAIEPNPNCCSALRALGHRRRLAIHCEAVGERQGGATLFLGHHSGHSTVSADWIEIASRNDPDYRWEDAREASMTTVDRLREEHGTPTFIKIDVEGYEAGVLRGISFRVDALQFEFHAFAPNYVRECLSLPVFDSGYLFNIVLSDSWRFVWPEWYDKDAVLRYVSELSGMVFGDIYAKRQA